MTDKFSTKERSQIMAAIKSKNTTPEMTLRRALFKRGLRYGVHYGREKIDIAFPKARIAILVDGCFWHSCPVHLRVPKTHKRYWLNKLAKNATRDKEKDLRLVKAGWKVIHIWEHSIPSGLEPIVENICSDVRAAKG